jgi:hypothetical protein
MKKKRRNAAALAKAVRDPNSELISLLIEGMELILFKGLTTLIVLNAFKLAA